VKGIKNMNNDWAYEILEDIENIDFKNCKKDCSNYDGRGTTCKHSKECSWFYYKCKDKFELDDLIKQFK
jgi:hypothetical protein